MTDRVYHKLEEMFVEDAGTHFLDSGGEDGRHWQQNRLRHPCDRPEVDFDGRYGYTVNTFRYLASLPLEFDDLCDAFNGLNTADRSDDAIFDDGYCDALDDLLTPRLLTRPAYGLLASRTVRLERSYNTYNSDYSLDHALCVNDLVLTDDDGYDERYILLSVHLGADIRGGYGIPVLFKAGRWLDGIYSCPDVYGTLKRDGETYSLDNCDRPYALTMESEADGREDYEWREGDEVDLRLAEY